MTNQSPAASSLARADSEVFEPRLFTPLHEIVTRIWLVIMLVSLGWSIGLIYFVVSLFIA